MRQTRFFIGAFEFEGREGGVRTIILYGRFTGKLSYVGYILGNISRACETEREREKGGER